MRATSQRLGGGADDSSPIKPPWSRTRNGRIPGILGETHALLVGSIVSRKGSKKRGGSENYVV
jgi:hypothetical protein